MSVPRAMTETTADQLLARLNQRAAALRVGGAMLEQARDAAFAAEGPGWAPLAESTVRQRGSAHPILQRSGSYRRSFVASYDDSSVVLASDDWRVAILNDGAGSTPARPLEIPAGTVQAAARAIARRLLTGEG